MYYRSSYRMIAALPLAAVAGVAATLAPPEGYRRCAADLLLMLYLSAIGEAPCS